MTTRSGRSPPVRLASNTHTGARDSNSVVRSDRSSISGTAKPTFCKPDAGRSAVTLTSASGLPNGNGLSNTDRTILNIVVLSPMPTPIVTTPTSVWLGDFRRLRRAPLRSLSSVVKSQASGIAHVARAYTCMPAGRAVIPGNNPRRICHLFSAGMRRHLRQEFDDLAMPYMAELLRMAARLLGDRSAAEDLLQETYLQA